jgi:hypothetical protein
MRDKATQEIKRSINAFYHGEPQHIEVEIADGVHFVSDNTFKMDLLEPTLTAAVLIEEDSPHNEGVAERHTTLSRYSGFGDTVMADVISQAVYDAGGEFTELVFEYSSNNSNEKTGFLTFLGSLPNQRVAYNAKTGETEINEVYA